MSLYISILKFLLIGCLSPVRHSWMLNVHFNSKKTIIILMSHSRPAGQYAFILKIQAGSHVTLRTKI
jgi:hypothetical protein